MWLPTLALTGLLAAEPTPAAAQITSPCARFEHSLEKQPFDAWAWNELAACHLKALHFDQVLEPLDQAAALERARPTPKLAAAIQVNSGRYTRALLEHPTAKGVAPGALIQARREWALASPEHRDLARQLFELCITSVEPFEFTTDDWNALGEARLAHGDALHALEAFLLAAKDGSVSAAADLLPDWEPPPATSDFSSARLKKQPWLSGCVALDETRRCGASWLACRSTAASPPVDSRYDFVAEQSWVFVDAAALDHLDEDPTTAAPAVVCGHSTLEERCPYRVSPADEWQATGLQSFENRVRLLAVDVCAGTVTLSNHRGTCSEEHTELEVLALTPVR